MVIEIAGQQWQVLKVESHDPGLFVDGTARQGACWFGKSVIYLADELSGDHVARTVMHELTHAYIYATQAAIPESWDEESVCDLFAIYAESMCMHCQAICKELFPEVKLRPWLTGTAEVRV